MGDRETLEDQLAAFLAALKNGPSAESGGRSPEELGTAVSDSCRAAQAAKTRPARLSLRNMASKESPLLRDLVAQLESQRDDGILQTLLEVVDLFLDSPRRDRRAKALAACNGVGVYAKQLVTRVRAGTPVSDPVRATLTKQLLVIAGKDGRAPVKLRLSGLIQLLAKEVPAARLAPLSSLDLIILSIKSGRNAVGIGREKEFLKWLTASLKDGDLDDLERLHRNVHILFFLCRTKKCRDKLMGQGMTGLLVKLLRRLGSIGGGEEGGGGGAADAEEARRLEVAHATLAALKQVGKTKSGREELGSSLALLESAVADSLQRGPDQTGAEAAQTVANLRRAVDEAVCALCLRCLPAKRMPLEGEPVKGRVFPLPSEARKLLNATPGPANPRDDSDGDSEEGEDILQQERDADSQDEEAEVVEEQRIGKREPTGSGGGAKAAKAAQRFFPELSLSGGGEVNGRRSSSQAATSGSKGRGKSRGRGGRSHSRERRSPEDRGGRSGARSNQLWERDFLEEAGSTRSVAPFARLAYPEWRAAYPDLPRQPLREYPTALRETVLEELAAWREAGSDTGRNPVVYDLDSLPPAPANTALRNEDAERLRSGSAGTRSSAPTSASSRGSQDPAWEGVGQLEFESRFESGNLRRAVRTGPREYELLLSPDVNQLSPHFQWFYFAVSGMEAQTPYTFTLPNFLKSHSMFNAGMQCQIRHWERIASPKVYFSVDSLATTLGGNDTPLLTITAAQGTHLLSLFPKVYFSVDSLATTLGGNDTPLLTITAAQGTHLLSLFPKVYFSVDSLATTLGGNDTPLLTITAAQGTHLLSLFPKVYFSVDSLATTLGGNDTPLLTITAAQGTHLLSLFPKVYFSVDSLATTLGGNDTPLLTITAAQGTHLLSLFPKVYFSVDSLATTLGGNDTPLLTITAAQGTHLLSLFPKVYFSVDSLATTLGGNDTPLLTITAAQGTHLLSLFPKVYFSVDSLATTLGGNDTPLLTITAAQGTHLLCLFPKVYFSVDSLATTLGGNDTPLLTITAAQGTHLLSLFPKVYFSVDSLATTLGGNDTPLLTITAAQGTHLLSLFPKVYFSVDSLATTLGGNDTPLLTITAAQGTHLLSLILDLDRSWFCLGDKSKRAYVLLSARVHPGESNSSWMMDGNIQTHTRRIVPANELGIEGTIGFLISPAAKTLREKFVFKIVPMLNPDGVVNGSHRCSLVGQDLNRQWASPSPVLHPTIHAMKELLGALVAAGRPPLVFLDYHGHSRKSNVFVFGNNPEETWLAEDATTGAGQNGEWSELPRELDRLAPAFSISDSRFDIVAAKESCARVVAWRAFRLPRAYTLEATYAGCDQGPYKGFHLGTRELREMGAVLPQALLHLSSTTSPSRPPPSSAKPPPSDDEEEEPEE